VNTLLTALELNLHPEGLTRDEALAALEIVDNTLGEICGCEICKSGEGKPLPFENALVEVLFTEWGKATKKSTNTAIRELMKRDGQLAAFEIENVLDIFEHGLETKFSENIEGGVGKHTKKAYRKGKKDVFSRFGLQADWDIIDTDATRWLKKHDMYWLGGYYNKHCSKKIAETIALGMEDGLGRAEIGKELKNFFEKYPGVRSKPDSYWRGVAANGMNRARTFGSLRSYDELGIKYLEVLAVVDERTSSICLEMNGRTIPVANAVGQMKSIMAAQSPEDIKINQPWLRRSAIRGKSTAEVMAKGVIAPPYHFHCRTTLVEKRGEEPKKGMEAQFATKWEYPKNVKTSDEKRKYRAKMRRKMGRGEEKPKQTEEPKLIPPKEPPELDYSKYPSGTKEFKENWKKWNKYYKEKELYDKQIARQKKPKKPKTPKKSPPPPKPKPTKPDAPTKIIYPKGMTDPKEKAKYRKKLRRERQFGNPPPPKGAVKVPPPVTPVVEEVDTYNYGSSTKHRLDKFIKEQESLVKKETAKFWKESPPHKSEVSREKKKFKPEHKKLMEKAYKKKDLDSLFRLNGLNDDKFHQASYHFDRIEKLNQAVMKLEKAKIQRRVELVHHKDQITLSQWAKIKKKHAKWNGKGKMPAELEEAYRTVGRVLPEKELLIEKRRVIDNLISKQKKMKPIDEKNLRETLEKFPLRVVNQYQKTNLKISYSKDAGATYYHEDVKVRFGTGQIKGDNQYREGFTIAHELGHAIDDLSTDFRVGLTNSDLAAKTNMVWSSQEHNEFGKAFREGYTSKLTWKNAKKIKTKKTWSSSEHVGNFENAYDGRLYALGVTIERFKDLEKNFTVGLQYYANCTSRLINNRTKFFNVDKDMWEGFAKLFTE